MKPVNAETSYSFAHRVKARSRNRYRIPTVGMKSVEQIVELLIQSNRQSVELPTKKQRAVFY